MKGFKIASRGSEQSELDLLREHKRMLDAGFTIDQEYNVYVREGYGALITNVSNKITRVEDMIGYYDKNLGSNPYQERVREMQDGYQYVIGPGMPATNGIVYDNALYCKNYQEIAMKQKQQSHTR